MSEIIERCIVEFRTKEHAGAFKQKLGNAAGIVITAGCYVMICVGRTRLQELLRPHKADVVGVVFKTAANMAESMMLQDLWGNPVTLPPIQGREKNE